MWHLKYTVFTNVSKYSEWMMESITIQIDQSFMQVASWSGSIMIVPRVASTGLIGRIRKFSSQLTTKVV